MISTHVLDIARGVPATGVAVVLEARDGAGWSTIGRGTTDDHGRIASFADAPPAAGTYRLTFDTGAYHRRYDTLPFFPSVAVTFDVREAGHHHVPLLLSPYGYSTYRGT
jgi:5-hydroxyisourate hydrolase